VSLRKQNKRLKLNEKRVKHVTKSRATADRFEVTGDLSELVTLYPDIANPMLSPVRRKPSLIMCR